jgi:hypothetical protein
VEGADGSLLDVRPLESFWCATTYISSVLHVLIDVSTTGFRSANRFGGFLGYRHRFKLERLSDEISGTVTMLASFVVDNDTRY